MGEPRRFPLFFGAVPCRRGLINLAPMPLREILTDSSTAVRSRMDVFLGLIFTVGQVFVLGCSSVFPTFYSGVRILTRRTAGPHFPIGDFRESHYV